MRLLFYRKIKSSVNLSEIEMILDELEDRFGMVPNKLKIIVDVQKLTILCQKKHIVLVEEKRSEILFQFLQKHWEQKVSYLLNKINEFICERAINYELKEFKQSLLLSLIKNDEDSLKLIKDLINIL